MFPQEILLFIGRERNIPKQYLQYKIGKKKPKHTKEYLEEEDRHIKLEEKLYVAAYVNDEKVYEDYIKANIQKPKVQAFVKRKKKMSKGKS